MSDALRILELHSRQRADVARMIVVRPGPRGTVIVRPECSADELMAVADRPFEAGEQVLVASSQGAPSTLRTLGALPAGKSGAAMVTASRRSALASLPALATFCPTYRPEPLWAVLGSSTQISLREYAGATAGGEEWVVDLEGDWGPITTTPFPLDIKRSGSIAMAQPAALQGVATIRDGAIARWDMALDTADGIISRPVWDGDRVAVAVRRATGAMLYRWDGIAHVDGIAPGTSWVAGPAGLPPDLTNPQIAVGPSGQLLYAESNHLWQRAGSTWEQLPDIEGSNLDLAVMDHRTALAGRWRIDLQARTVALWQEWTEGIGDEIYLPYSVAGGSAMIGYPYRTDIADYLISVDLPPLGQRWSPECVLPLAEMEIPAGWAIVGAGPR